MPSQEFLDKYKTKVFGEGSSSEPTPSVSFPKSAFESPSSKNTDNLTLDQLVSLSRGGPQKEKIKLKSRAELKSESLKASMDAAKYEAILEGEEVPLPRLVKQRKWQEEAGVHPGQNVNNFLDYLFDRLGRGNRFVLRDSLAQLRATLKDPQKAKEYQEKFGGIRGAIADQSHKIDLFKKGFSLPEDDRASGRDIVAAAFGEESVNNFDQNYKNIGDSMRAVADKIDEKIGSINVAGFGKYSPYTTPTIRSIAKAMDLTPMGTYLGIEIATDYLTYVPFKLIPALGKSVFQATTRGAYAGIAKISPPTAHFIDKVTSKAADWLGNKWAHLVDPKYGATKAAKTVMPEEDAISTVTSIMEEVHRPAAEAEALVSGLKAEGVPVERLGAFRRQTRKIAEKFHWEPKNGFNAYLFGMTDKIKMQEETFKVLTEVEEQTLTRLPKDFRDTAKSMMSLLLKDKYSEKEVHTLVSGIDATAKKIRRSKSLHVTEDQAIGDVIKLKFTEDVKEVFTDSKNEIVKRAFTIAKDRRDLKLNQVEANFKVLKAVSNKAGKEIRLLERQKGKASQEVYQTSVKTFGHKYAEEQRNLFRSKADIMNNLKENAKVAIQDLKNKPLPKGSLAERARFSRERNKGIHDIETLLQNETLAVEKKFNTQLDDMRRSILREKSSFIGKEIEGIEDVFNQRTVAAKFGMPKPKEIDGMYLRAKEQISKEFKLEKMDFVKDVRRLKFIEVWNKNLDRNRKVYDKIASDGFKHLPTPMQKFAPTFKDVMEEEGAEMVGRDRLHALLPNYVARIFRSKEGGVISFDKSDFSRAFTRLQSSTGISRHSKKRAFIDAESFSAWAKQHNGEAEKDIWNILYEYTLKSKMDKARWVINNMLPDSLKEGKAGKQMGEFLDYLYNGTKNADLYASKATKLYGAWQYYTKSLLTLFSPTFYFRNLIGYPQLQAREQGVKGFNAQNFIDATAIRLGIGPETLVNDLGERMSRKEFMDTMMKYGVTTSSFTRGGIPQRGNQILNRYPKGDPRYWIATGLHWSQNLEDTGRTFGAYSFWKQGMPIKEAARKAKITYFNFTDFNRVDRFIHHWFAFYGFSRKNIPSSVKSLVKDPKQYAILDKLTTAMSLGQKPDEEDVREASTWDTKRIQFWSEISLGMAEAYKLGFFLIEDTYELAQSPLRGDWAGWIEDVAGKFSPGAKTIIQQTANKIKGSKAEPEDYQYLPREYSVLPDKAVGWINTLSKSIGWGPVKKKSRVVYDHGEAKVEEGVLVPPQVYSFLNEQMWSRVLKEQLGLTKAFKESLAKGDVPEKVTPLSLLKSGAFESNETFIKWMTGISRMEFNWNDLRMKNKKFELRKLQEASDAAKKSGVIHYIPKEIQKLHQQKIMEKQKEMKESKRYKKVVND